MNGLLSVELVFDICLKCAATAALGVLTWLLIRWARGSKVNIWIHTPGFTWTATTTAMPPISESISAQAVEKPAEVPEKSTEVRAEATVSPKKVEPAQDIECGNCHNDILSQPVTSMLVDHKYWLVYNCEHCGTQVKLPVC